MFFLYIPKATNITLQSSNGQKIAIVDNLQPGSSTVAAIFLFPLGLSVFSICLSLSYRFFLYVVGFLEFSSFCLVLLQSNLEQGKMSNPYGGKEDETRADDYRTTGYADCVCIRNFWKLL